jgi:hypothetical protein
MNRSAARVASLLTAIALLAACAGGPSRREQGSDDRAGSAYRQSAFLTGAALLFVQFDTDHDYATTRAETETGARAEWARASGGAAKITPIAFEQWAARALGGPQMGPYRLAFDTNVDNEITAAEFSAAILDRFDRYDTDKDGVLRRTDMIERLPESPRGPGGPPGGGAPKQRPGGGEPR